MSSLGRGEGAQSFPGISEGLPSVEVGWDGQRGNHISPSHAPETKSPISTSFPPSAEGLLAPHLLRASRCGTGVFGQPHHGPGAEHGEGLELRELGQGTGGAGASRRRCPGQAGPGGLGVAVPPLQEFPPVGVIGNRLGAGRDAGSRPAPQGPPAGKVFPAPCWRGDPGQSPGSILCAPHAQHLHSRSYRTLQPTREASVVPPCRTGLNTEGPYVLDREREEVGDTWGSRILGCQWASRSLGPESLSRVWEEQMNFPGAPR